MKVFVDVHDKRWNKYKIDFEKIANTAVSGVHKNSEVSIVLVDDSEIHELNKNYRGMDKPTNVISFELGDDVLLGDIYISFDTALREAKDENISLENHVAHLVVHGVLHLLGFDHITDDQANIMEMKEIQVLKKLGIKNPYQDEEDFVCDCEECCPGGRFLSWFRKLTVKENGVLQYALYAVFGGLAAFGFAPFYQWWWTIVGVAGAFWLTVRNKNIGGFWQSLMRVAPFGAMYSVAMFWWVLNSIYVVPELAEQFAIWTLPGIVGLALAGVFIFSWPFVAVAQKKFSAGGRVFLFAAVWTLVLWGREWLFTGFPWNPIANITMPWPMLANAMSLFGTLGLTFVIVGAIAVLVELLRNPKSKVLWCVLFVFALLFGGGLFAGYKNMQASDVGAENPAVLFRIVQPAQSQLQKATHNRQSALEQAQFNLQNLAKLAMQPGNPDVIVFPETTYPFVVVENDNIELARVLQRPVIIGATSFDAGKIFNSMLLVEQNGEIQKIYSKSHLVPFGEYSPLGILPSPANLTRGNGPEILSVANLKFAPAICYEVIFSDSLLNSDVDDVQAIINITNDNWFGKTPGTYQHLDMVRRYAIESGMPIIRANYSGISAFVGADGVVISSLPIGAVDVLDGYVWGGHKTPYRMIGLNKMMILILLVAMLGIACCQKFEKD